MRIKVYLVLFLIIFGKRSESLSSEEQTSKIICHFRRLHDANIYEEQKLKAFKLSKYLLNECNIRIKIISNVTNIFNNFVTFVGDNNYKNVRHLMESRDISLTCGIIFVKRFQMIDELPSKINQDIKFVHTKTWNVYEHYIINKNKVKNILGFFNSSFP